MKERTGSITKKNGKLIVRVTYTDKLGKRRELIRQADSKADAKKLQKELIKEAEDKVNQSPQQIEGDQMTFKMLAEKYKAKKLIPAEYEGDKKVRGLKSLTMPLLWIERLIDHFGKASIHDIDSSVIEEYRDERLKTGLKHASVNRELELMRIIFNYAKNKKWMIITPFDSADEPIIRKSLEVKRDRILSTEEETKLLEQCVGRRAHLRAILITALDTGLRRSEMFKLEVRDVDMKNGVIKIREKNSKTGEARIVPVSPRMRLELESLLKDKQPSDSVFGIKIQVIKGFYTALEKAKIEDFRLHDCRHTAITRMIEAGISHVEVMKISGHTQMITFQRYLNMQPKRLQKIANQLAEHLMNEALEREGMQDDSDQESTFIN